MTDQAATQPSPADPPADSSVSKTAADPPADSNTSNGAATQAIPAEPSSDSPSSEEDAAQTADSSTPKEGAPQPANPNLTNTVAPPAQTNESQDATAQTAGSSTPQEGAPQPANLNVNKTAAQTANPGASQPHPQSAAPDTSQALAAQDQNNQPAVVAVKDDDYPDPVLAMLKDRALRSAFQDLDQYDGAAVRLKNQYTNPRAAVLLVGFIATLLAVSQAAANQLAIPAAYVLIMLYRYLGINLFISPDLLNYVVGILLIVLPLTASGILVYMTQQNTPSPSWASYRVSAEKLRRAIYLYCMSAGDYADKSPEAKRKLLAQAQQEIISDPNPMPVSVVARAKSPSDDQYQKWLIVMFKQQGKPLRQKFWSWAYRRVRGEDQNVPDQFNFDDYYTNRFEEQLKWFESKAAGDYRTAREWQLAGLLIGGIGSLLTYQKMIPWVAVTTAAAVAITQFGNLKMFGRTYTSYQGAANVLRIQRANWLTLPESKQSDPAQRTDFITEAENNFATEIASWIQIVGRNAAEENQYFSQQGSQQGQQTSSSTIPQTQQPQPTQQPTQSQQTQQNGNTGKAAG